MRESDQGSQLAGQPEQHFFLNFFSTHFFVFCRSTSISKRSIVSPRCMAGGPIRLCRQRSSCSTRCQGVSGRVCFEGRELLAISPHMEYASVSFSQLEQGAHELLIALLPAFPGITAMKQAASHLPIPNCVRPVIISVFVRSLLG